MDRRSLLKGAMAAAFVAMFSGCGAIEKALSNLWRLIPTGAFIVVWQDGPDSNSSIRVRGLNSDGKDLFPPAFTDAPLSLLHGTKAKSVEPWSTGPQRLPAVAASEKGFVVTWVESVPGVGGAEWGVRIKGFALNGKQLFNTETIEKKVPFNQSPSWHMPFYGPRIAMAKDGTFVVCWDRGCHFPPRARTYDFKGKPISGFVEIAPAPAGGHGGGFLSDVAIANDGSFAVTYSEPVGCGVGGATFVRGFKSDGANKFGPKKLNNRSALRQAIAMSPDGSKVIVAQACWYEADKDRLLAHILTVGEDPVAKSTVSVYPGESFVSSNELFPAVAINKDGRFCVVWHDARNQGSPSTDIRASFFEPDGSPSASDLLVNSRTTGSQLYPVVACNQAHAFMIVWEDSDVTDGDAFARGLLAGGLEYFNDIRVNPTTDGRQGMPRVAMVPTTSNQP